MPTRKQIETKYKKLHDDLSESFYNGTSGLTKQEFDIQHAKIWDDMETELKTASDYIAPVSPRDLATEIDELKARIRKLEARSMPLT